MADVILTLKIMPESVDVDLDKLQERITEEIKSFSGETEMKFEKQPLAFGLNSLNVIFVMDESKGSTDSLEETINTFEEVVSVEVTDVRRAIG